LSRSQKIPLATSVGQSKSENVLSETHIAMTETFHYARGGKADCSLATTSGGAGVFGNESEESFPQWVTGVTKQLSPKPLVFKADYTKWISRWLCTARCRGSQDRICRMA